MLDFVERRGVFPVDEGYDTNFKLLYESFELLDIVGSRAVAEAADEYLTAFYNWYEGGKSSDAWQAAREKYRTAMRNDLSLDTVRSLPKPFQPIQTESNNQDSIEE